MNKLKNSEELLKELEKLDEKSKQIKEEVREKYNIDGLDTRITIKKENNDIILYNIYFDFKDKNDYIKFKQNIDKYFSLIKYFKKYDKNFNLPATKIYLEFDLKISDEIFENNSSFNFHFFYHNHPKFGGVIADYYYLPIDKNDFLKINFSSINIDFDKLKRYDYEKLDKLITLLRKHKNILSKKITQLYINFTTNITEEREFNEIDLENFDNEILSNLFKTLNENGYNNFESIRIKSDTRLYRGEEFIDEINAPILSIELTNIEMDLERLFYILEKKNEDIITELDVIKLLDNLINESFKNLDFKIFSLGDIEDEDFEYAVFKYVEDKPKYQIKLNRESGELNIILDKILDKRSLRDIFRWKEYEKPYELKFNIDIC